MDFTTLITHLEAGDTDKAVEVAKALKPKFEQTVKDLADYEGKFNDSIGTRDKAKAKIKAIADVLGTTEDELTPTKIKEIMDASKKDDGSKAEIENLTRLLEEKDANYTTSLEEKDKLFSDKLVEIEIAKLGLTSDVVNDKRILSLVIDHLKDGAVIEDGAVVYKDGDVTKRNGSGRPETVAERMEAFKADAENANLFKPTTTGGGGSQNGGSTGSKKWTDYDSAGLVELHRTNPTEYQRIKNEHNKL